MSMCIHVCRYTCMWGVHVCVCVCVRAEEEGTCNVERVDIYVGWLHMYVEGCLGENLK